MNSGAVARKAAFIHLAINFDGANFSQLKSAIENVIALDSIFHQVLAPDGRVENTQNIPSVRLSDFSDAKNPNRVLFSWLEARSKQSLAKASFDFELIRLSDSAIVLALSAHHALVDGWSLANFLGRVVKLYNGEAPQQSYLQFDDFKKKYRKKIHQIVADSGPFWSEQLKSLKLEDWVFSRQEQKAEYAAQRVSRSLSSDFIAELNKVGRKHKVSKSVLLLHLFSRALKDYMPNETAAIAIPVGGRFIEKSESMIGNCVNLMPILVSRKQSLLDLKKQYNSSLPHMDLPLSEVEKMVGRKFVSVSFNIEPVQSLPKMDNIRYEVIDHPISFSEYPLTANITILENGATFYLDFWTSVMNQEEAQMVLEKMTDLKSFLK